MYVTCDTENPVELADVMVTAAPTERVTSALAASPKCAVVPMSA